MKAPELTRLLRWRDRFLRDRELLHVGEDLVKELGGLTGRKPEERLLQAVRAFQVGGGERRLEDPNVRYWANWAALKTYETFNRFPHLSDAELAFVFYALGKLFVPLLLHDRGVRSPAFGALPPEEKESAVLEELDTLWETQLPLLLRALQLLELNSMRK